MDSSTHVPKLMLTYLRGNRKIRSAVITILEDLDEPEVWNSAALSLIKTVFGSSRKPGKKRMEVFDEYFQRTATHYPYLALTMAKRIMDSDRIFCSAILHFLRITIPHIEQLEKLECVGVELKSTAKEIINLDHYQKIKRDFARVLVVVNRRKNQLLAMDVNVERKKLTPPSGKGPTIYRKGNGLLLRQVSQLIIKS
jgi:hypothetical protein